MAHSFGRMRERKITTPYLHFPPKNSIILIIISETAPQGKAAQVSPLLFSNSALKGALMQEDIGFCRRVWHLTHAKSPSKTAQPPKAAIFDAAQGCLPQAAFATVGEI